MEFKENILQQLNEIGIALSKEPSLPKLHEMILKYAMDLTHADGGTIYSVIEKKSARFEIFFSRSRNLHLGGTSSKPIPFADLPLYLENGLSNDSLIVAYSINHKKMVNIKDAYHEAGFDFSGTRRIDEKTGYQTKTVLTVPMKNHEDEVIAVLQLINAIDPLTGEVIGFSEKDTQLAMSLASQAGVALNNQLLIQNLKQLFESLIRVIAEAIDEKSPVTGNHGKRVPLLAASLAQAVNETHDGLLKEIHFSDEELYELRIASLLHDCGKITTPVHIVEKRKKMETIFDRIEMIDARFSCLFLKEEIELLKRKLNWIQTNDPEIFEKYKGQFQTYEQQTREKVNKIQEDQSFLHACNEGKVKIDETAIERVGHLATTEWDRGQSFLTPDEIENLLIPQGNLTEKERKIIQNHVIMTYRMLSNLPFPKELRNVPEIAASHHERMDGKGYPRGLKGNEMLLQARILAIADVFESLSAPDRPYRRPAPLSQVLQIMKQMVEEGHLDKDLFDIFVKKKVYLEYANRYLKPEQLDECEDRF